MLLTACSRSPTLNLHDRTFGQTPKNVIWIQLPGFELEHASLIRFSSSDSRRLSMLEDMDCVGSAWSYNNYEIRPGSVESMLSQMTGSADIKDACAPSDRYPAWQYYRALGLSTFGIESGVDDKSSLATHETCAEGKFLEGLTLLSMRSAGKTKDPLYFHYQTKKELEPGRQHFDQTCQGGSGKCFATLLGNIRSIWEQASSGGKGVFLLIRNFDYLRELKNKNIQSAREVLSEIDKIVAYFREQPNSDQTLIFITGAETQSLRLPARGKEWSEFEKRGRNVLLERSRLVAPVLARGPSAENFCGVYEESRILYRQFWRNGSNNFSLESIIGLRP